MGARTYSVELHSHHEQSGDWLCFRNNGFCFYPMRVYPHEGSLSGGRFSKFTTTPQEFPVDLFYTVLMEGRPFTEIVEWISERRVLWSFSIDPQNHQFARPCRFTFSDLKIAIEFSLRWV